MQHIYYNTIQQVNDHFGIKTLHPLITVVHLDKRTEMPEELCYHYGVYGLWLKETKGCTISYGRTPYDFDEMTVTSFAPGQQVDVKLVDPTIQPKCVGILFHPDFLNRTHLGSNIRRYEFFDYTSTEALHLSPSEIVVFRQVVDMIEQELHHAIDSHTRELIVSNIELLLNYCLRFYDRQFVTREEINHSVAKKFLSLLDEYIAEKAEREGLPTVAWFADKCCLSNGYFGTLIKTETGRTAKDLINDRLLAKAKELLQSDVLSVSQVSQRLGFEYPQHFVRFFKSLTGKTPAQWRAA